MAKSYVITGTSKGIGLEFVRQLSAVTTNQVFAIVRNKSTSTNLIELASKNKNIQILEADVTNYAQMKAAAAEVSKYTEGTLDVLVNNAAFVNRKHGGLGLADYKDDDVLRKDLLESFEVNVIGVIHSINAFLDLVKAGQTKKVITISTGVADPDAIWGSGLYQAAPYGISKAALNMTVTKYAIQFKPEGIIFLALSPGLVDTAERPVSPQAIAMLQAMTASIRKSVPTFNGPITPEESVRAQLNVIDGLTLEDTGGFISHHGNKNWV
ncbi:hypothetical protein M422DRAFT_34348 [Sphaerobolus stellatus SS14]|uniref:Unplaced genomic scaffold SPHSTscaffold_104, whole genome shotgun sequence n=1 Tax=Sphaerobolus stellatus (strain SS14) TaxID=990650 RepID=A0A0C9V3U1_SPHS4|nr:hypothetical protein M422DRAFT_34348 [Sphaerobolus stellatus SS14]